MAVLTGCATPRTGIAFQSTKSNCNDAAWGEMVYYGLILSPFVIPPIIFLPSAGLGYSLDHYLCSPLHDVFCSPYDWYLRETGPYIKVVDTNGRPISHAHVNAPAVTGVGTFQYTGETDSEGLFRIPLSWRNSVLGRGDVKAEGFVTTPMDSPRLLHHRSWGTSWQKTKDGDIQHEVVMLRKGETLPLVVKSVVLNTKDYGVYALDVVEGDWCSPHGRGMVGDLQFRFERDGCFYMSSGFGYPERGAGIVKLKPRRRTREDLAELIGTNSATVVKIDLHDSVGKRPALSRIRGAGTKKWAFHTDVRHGVYGIIHYLDCWGDVNSGKRTVVLQYVYNPNLDCPMIDLSSDVKLPPPPMFPPRQEYITY